MADRNQLSNAEIISNDTFERLKSRNSRRRLLRILSYVLIAVFLVAVFVIVCVVVFFKVGEIQITGTQIYGYDNENILELSGIELEQNMYAVNSKYVKEVIINNYPYVKDVKLKRHLPDTIEIELIEDTPIYYIVIGGEYFILSEDLRVLEKVEDIDRIERINISYKLIRLELPVVIYAVEGKQIVFKRATNYAYTINLLELIQASDIIYNISKVSLINKYNIYLIYGNYKLIIGNNENISSKINLAKEIISRITNDPAIIDITDITKGSVRQDSQVVIN